MKTQKTTKTQMTKTTKVTYSKGNKTFTSIVDDAKLANFVQVMSAFGFTNFVF